jgi:ubiquinone/menaquinone biosynthesis C-methylase UbiE
VTAPAAGAAFDAFERQGWITAAHAYDEFFGPITSQVVDPLLDAVHAEAGDTLVDLACGPGHLLDVATRRGVRAVGVDASPTMLELARRTAPAAAIRWGDVQHLTFADASFDAATAAFVLMHVADPERVVAEAARVLRPGGRLGVAVWDDPVKARLLGWLLDAIDEVGAEPPPDLPAGPAFFAYAEDAALRRLLERAWFCDVEVHTVGLAHRLPSVDDVWRGLVEGTVRTSALLRGQDATTLARVREAFVAIASSGTDAGGGIRIPVSVKLGVGVRRAP